MDQTTAQNSESDTTESEASQQPQQEPAQTEAAQNSEQKPAAKKKEEKEDKKDELTIILEKAALSPIEIEIYVKEFADNYFKDVEEVTIYNVNFLEENHFIEPKLDYTKLKRFIDTAMNNIRELSPGVIDDLLGKLRNHVKAIFDFQQEFIQKNKVNKAIYKRDFLGRLKPYNDLSHEIEKSEAFRNKFEAMIASTDAELKMLGQPKGVDEIRNYKILKKKNIDSIHHLAVEKEKVQAMQQALLRLEEMCEEEFFAQFDDKKRYYTEAMNSIANTLTYYMDKLFWSRAQESPEVTKFFRDAEIREEIGLKSYIGYYLKGINIATSGNREWHEYLQKCMEEMD